MVRLEEMSLELVVAVKFVVVVLGWIGSDWMLLIVVMKCPSI